MKNMTGLQKMMKGVTTSLEQKFSHEKTMQEDTKEFNAKLK
jgi:hypothetical protein